MKQDELFCVGQKAFIDKDGELLILNDPLLGQDMPGGKIQEGERDFVKALQREVVEETGLEIEVGDPFHIWYFEVTDKRHRNVGKKVFIVGYKCKYISGEITLSTEHDSYEWVNKTNYHKLKGEAFFEGIEKFFSFSI